MSFVSITPDGNSDTSKLIYYISETSFENTLQSLPHLHHFTEIIFVSEGVGKIFMNEEFCTIKKGDIVIIKNGIMHAEVDNDIKLPSAENDTEETFSYYSIGLKKVSFENLDPQNFIFNATQYTKQVTDCFSNLFFELRNKKKYYDEIAGNYIDTLYNLIERITLLTRNEVENTQLGALKDVLEYIDANYNHDITLDFLSTMAYVSKSHLIRLFNSTTGMTPMEYLDARRTAAAKTLLQTTSYTVTEISIILNYPSVSTFIAKFKSHNNNITPLQYRKVIKAENDNK